MLSEAIILAGGQGTRLQETVPGLPKAMAPVAGKPFISYVIDYLRMQGVQHFIFALGYKADVIISYLEEQYATLSFKVLVENEPMGTGGAIKAALAETIGENVIVTNGDTLFKINYNGIVHFHLAKNSICTLALKHLKNVDRYGAVITDKEGKITSFSEKKENSDGLINGGIYILNKNGFNQINPGNKFSFESDFLEKHLNEDAFFGYVQDSYFIDIGISDEYNKANQDLNRQKPELKDIDENWSLFLDRDGVINDEIEGRYILNWKEFKFSAGVLAALKRLNKKFKRIIVVSNQRGVGKFLMTEVELREIHKEMQKEITAAGGKIDKIYYCTETSDKHPDRKPNPGMALQAIHDFKDIVPEKSIMIGNKPGDMRFGRFAGMVTVFITSTNPDQPFPHADIDFKFPSLESFAQALES